jgi:hypothetical protein
MKINMLHNAIAAKLIGAARRNEVSISRLKVVSFASVGNNIKLALKNYIKTGIRGIYDLVTPARVDFTVARSQNA